MALELLSRWRPRHLLGAWTAWWAGLAAATLGPAARAVWHVTHLPEGQGSASLSFDEGVLTFITSAGGVPTYTGTASLLAIGLWIAVPPLLLWAAWLASRGDRTVVAPTGGIGSPGTTRPALGAADPFEEAARRDLDARATAEDRPTDAAGRVASGVPKDRTR